MGHERILIMTIIYKKGEVTISSAIFVDELRGSGYLIHYFARKLETSAIDGTMMESIGKDVIQRSFWIQEERDIQK